MTLPENATEASDMDSPMSVTGRFRKRPVIVSATRWWKNGDHPEDGVGATDEGPDGTPFTRVEGTVVRFYRHPEVSGTHKCAHCGQRMHDHGWIDTLEGGHIVCPGDWIVTGIAGERYPVKPRIFEDTYEPVSE